ncbi:MAG: FkbM family methyltransferase [Actinomycetota bacterium]
MKLRVPLSHELPHYRRSHERYALNVATLAQLVSESNEYPTMVDIGANVGDTAAIARSGAPGLPILCIEGDPAFAALLTYNLAEWPDVKIHAPCVLAEGSGVIAGHLESRRGTAKFHAEGRPGVSVSSLDDVLDRYPGFSSPALIKSDTDGFEARVVAGAARTLERAHPVLFLEYDPRLLSACGSDGLELLGRLRKHEYGSVVVYDNFGDVLCLADIHNVRLFEDLHRYASRRPFFYFDLAVFPLDRPRDAQELYRRETTRSTP